MAWIEASGRRLGMGMKRKWRGKLVARNDGRRAGWDWIKNSASRPLEKTGITQSVQHNICDDAYQACWWLMHGDNVSESGSILT